jgi:hypothetical protein
MDNAKYSTLSKSADDWFLKKESTDMEVMNPMLKRQFVPGKS